MSKKLTVTLSVGKIIATIAIVGLIALVGWLAYDKFRPIDDGPIPQDVVAKLDFTPIVVDKNAEQYKASDYQYTAMEDGIKRLVFNVTLDQNKTAIFTEEPQPPQFYDIAEYKNKFLENKSEQTVNTDMGVIYLSRPENQKGKYIGLMLEKGLIVFINPSQDLTKEEWRALGNALTTQKTR